MDIKITPHPLGGTIHAPTSKSDAHRLLICAALADKPSELLIKDRSDDMDATIRCLAAMGASVENDGGVLRVTPISGTVKNCKADCGESGSTLRFLLPVAASILDSAEFTGHGRLPERPIGELLNVMSKNGVSFSNSKLPLTISGRLRGGNVYALPGNVSSQYITGLMLALPQVGGGEIRLTTKLQSSAYVTMTINAMKKFGVEVEKTSGGWIVADKHFTAPDGIIIAEGDWSNAAFFLTAGAICGEISVAGLDLDSAQGDRAVCRVLADFGAEVRCNNTVTVKQNALTGQTIDISDIPDLLPILSIAAAYSYGETHFTGGARLRIKESDRLKAAADLINSLGGDATELPDGLIVNGSGSLHGGNVNGWGDHRIVMSAAIAGAFANGETVIHGAEAVNKSYPSFFDVFRLSGGIADVI